MKSGSLRKKTSFLIPARGRQNIISIVDSDPTQSLCSFQINMLFSNFLLERIRGERTDKFLMALRIASYTPDLIFGPELVTLFERVALGSVQKSNHA